MTKTPAAEEIERAIALVDESDRVTVLTGAGISTDSGIPDFRGPKGLWTLDPDAEKMATLQHYVADSEIRKKSWRAKMDWVTTPQQPNAGHRALVELERRHKLAALVTQNVDGLHHEAGSNPEKIIEIHGTMREFGCLECGERGPIEEALERVRAGEEDPACRSCGGMLKSATISFGQAMVEADIQRAAEAARACDLMLAIGSTLSVYPIASIVPIAKESGAALIIVNAEPTEMDSLADLTLPGSISEILPIILGGEDSYATS